MAWQKIATSESKRASSMARFLRQEHRLPHRGSFDSEDAASFGRGHESRDEFNKLMEGYLREEEEYIQVLVELTEIYCNLKGREERESRDTLAVSADVIGCLSSSTAMMHALSKDMIELLQILSELDVPSATSSLRSCELEGEEVTSSSEELSEKEEDPVCSLCVKIISSLPVYEAFCNNENGVCHVDSLQLYMNDRSHTTPKSHRYSLSLSLFRLAERRSYSELILYPYTAVDRYEQIFSLLATRYPTVSPFVDDTRSLQGLISPSKRQVIRAIKLVGYLKQIKDLPSNYHWLQTHRECFKYGPVKKRKVGRLSTSDKERLFYLFGDILVYCTGSNLYKGMFRTDRVSLRDIDSQPTQFLLAVRQGENMETKYTITTESLEEKEDWMQKLHTVISSHGKRSVGALDRGNIERNLSLTEEEVVNLRQSMILPLSSSTGWKELKEYRECLNAATVWTSSARPAVDVSVSLLRMIITLYTENRGILERFGEQGFNLLCVHSSFKEFEAASAELQSVRLHDLMEEEKIVFWMNVYNALSLHAQVRAEPNTLAQQATFQSNSKYTIGGHIFSLLLIEHAILRAAMSTPLALLSFRSYPKFKKTDVRSAFALQEPHPLINFALNLGSLYSPPVVLYTAERWEVQLQMQAKNYCREHVRVFLHSNQRKVVLPKLFSSYWKDFGPSQRAMLVHLRDHYLPPTQQSELAFLDDANASVNIRFDGNEWEFKYPIGDGDSCCLEDCPSVHETESVDSETSGVGCLANSIDKDYVLLINQHHVYVRDYLTESPYAFMVPYQLLSLWVAPRRQALRQFGKEMGTDPMRKNTYEKQVQHLTMLTEALAMYKLYVTHQGDYCGLYFRPSTYRKDAILQFVPVNMQQQYMKVACDDKFDQVLARFTHVTFGAPAAHLYRFKNGGLRQLLEWRTRLEEIEGDLTSEQYNELMDVQAQIQMRLDVCLPAAVSGLVTALAQFLQYARPPSFYEQLAYCGLLVQFECLLSTHGAESGMIGDMDVVVHLLSYFHIRFLPMPTAGLGSNDLNPRISHLPAGIEITRIPTLYTTYDLLSDYLLEWYTEDFDLLPPSLQAGKPVPVHAVLFTQGINEHQTVAIRLGETRLQESINTENIVPLQHYFNLWQSYHQERGTPLDHSEHHATLQRIKHVVETSKNEKNVEILPSVADFVRELDGLRLTSCKSAKDRTSMSITWEQARFLNRRVALSSSLVFKVANDMRSRGVRRENAFRNIGKQKFKFNRFQRKILPREYQIRKV